MVRWGSGSDTGGSAPGACVKCRSNIGGGTDSPAVPLLTIRHSERHRVHADSDGNWAAPHQPNAHHPFRDERAFRRREGPPGRLTRHLESTARRPPFFWLFWLCNAPGRTRTCGCRGLGNRRSIHLSYGGSTSRKIYPAGDVPTTRAASRWASTSWLRGDPWHRQCHSSNRYPWYECRCGRFRASSEAAC